ncbi:MAG: hypothetical protein PUK36_01520, partial [Prevotella sp.]|nr:hypothetical protein [Prevotella sp.]
LLSAITPKKQSKKGILRLGRRTNPSKKRIKAKGRRKASLLKKRHTPRFPPSFFYVLPQSPPQKGNFYFSRLTCPCIYAYARDEVLADSNKTKSV